MNKKENWLLTLDGYLDTESEERIKKLVTEFTSRKY